MVGVNGFMRDIYQTAHQHGFEHREMSTFNFARFIGIANDRHVIFAEQPILHFKRHFSEEFIGDIRDDDPDDLPPVFTQSPRHLVRPIVIFRDNVVNAFFCVF